VQKGQKLIVPTSSILLQVQCSYIYQ